MQPVSTVHFETPQCFTVAKIAVLKNNAPMLELLLHYGASALTASCS